MTANLIHVVSKFVKNGDAFVGEVAFATQPSADYLRRVFHETGPMIHEYAITPEIARAIEPMLEQRLDLDAYDYFLSTTTMG